MRTGKRLAALLVATMAATCGAHAALADQLPPQPDGSMLPSDRCPDLQSMVEFSNSDYAQDLVADFNDLIYYPEEAAKAGEGGKVMLCLHLNHHGKVLEAYVMTGSGHPMLDGAALLSAGMLQLQQESTNWNPVVLPDHRQDAWMALPVDFNKIANIQQAEPPPAPGACASWIAGRPTDAVEVGNPASQGPAAGIKNGPAPSFDKSFFYQLHDGITQGMVYPRAAARAEQKGLTLLCVTIDRESHIRDAAILHSSGFATLDGAALMGVGRAQLDGKFPPVPEQVFPKVSNFFFTLPVTWELRSPALTPPQMPPSQQGETNEKAP